MNRILFQQCVRVAAAMAAMALWLTVSPARAQAPQFGLVDFARCIEESKLNTQSTAEFQGLQNGLERVLQRLQQGGAFFLSPAEIKELTGLYEKAQPAEPDKKRIADLEAKADQKSGALKRLETAGAQLTDEQRKQLEDLTNTQQAGMQALQGIQEEFKTRLQTRGRELARKVETEIRAAVAKVAKEKGLTVVFLFENVAYAQVDITEDVLKAVK